MIDLSKYDEFLIPSEKGLSIKEDCPQNIKNELIELDKDYFNVYGEHLIQIEN